MTVSENRKICSEAIQNGFSNVVKCSSGSSESENHRLTKFILANFCWQNNIQFSTEVTFNNGERCDFLVKDWALAIEILETETAKKFLKKQYPIPTMAMVAAKPSKDAGRVWISIMMQDLAQMEGTNHAYYTKNTFDELKVRL